MGKGKIRQKSPTTAYLFSGASEQLEIIGGKYKLYFSVSPLVSWIPI